MSDLRSTLEAAVSQHSQQETTALAPSPAPTPAPPAPSSTTDAPAPAPEADSPSPAPAPAQKSDGSDDPSGKTPGDGTGTDPKNEPGGDEDATDPKPRQTAHADRAPQSWKPAAKATWQNLPLEVRQEVARREREMERGLAETARERKFAREFQQTVAPFAARYQANGMAPVQVVKALMQADHILSSAPATQRAQFMAKMISDYGIDVGMLDQALSGTLEQRADPKNQIQEMLAQQLAPLQEIIARQAETERQGEQARAQQLMTELQRMEDDPTKYPHFDAVREDMADVLELQAKRGVSLSLDQAYTRAVAMNPDFARQSQNQQANDRAQRALAASSSVGGSPASIKTGVQPTDLRGTIEAAFAHHTRG